MIYQQPEVVAVIFLAYLVGIWILCIFGQQIVLIMSHTTTLETLNGDKEYWRGGHGSVTLHTQEGVAYYETITAGTGGGILTMLRELQHFLVTGQYRLVSRATVRIADEKVARDIRLHWVDDCFDRCCARLSRAKSSVIRTVRAIGRRGVCLRPFGKQKESR